MKKTLSIFIMLVCLFSVFALDFDGALNLALDNSRDVESYKNDYSYQTLAIKTSDGKSGFSVAAEVGNLKVTDNSNLYPNATLTIGLPEFIDDFEVNAAVSTSHSEETALSAEKYTVQPSVSLSKVFTFRSYKYTVEDLAKERNLISADSKYESGILSVKSSFIDSLISIMEAKVEIEKLKKNLSNAETQLKASITSGSIDSGTLAEIDANKQITSIKQNLESKERSLSNLLEDFKADYGFDYQDITSVSDSDLSFEANINDSSSVRSAEIALETAKQKYEEKVGFKATVSLGATGSSTVDFDKDYKNPTASYNANVSANVNIDNLSLTAVYTGELESDKYTSSVTVSGKWNNNPKTKDAETLEILELQNDLFEAQKSYDEAVRKYKRSAESLEASIQSWTDSYEQQEIDTDYNLKVLEYKTKLYGMGYITIDELNEAITDVNVDEIETLVIKLKAKQLEYKILEINL